MKNTLSIVARAVALLGLTLLAAGTLAAAATGPAHAQGLGTLALNPNSGSITDDPMAIIAVPAGCPEDFQVFSELYVRPAGSTQLGAFLANTKLGELLGGEDLGQPFTFTEAVDDVKSLGQAFGLPPADGGYEIRAVCMDFDGVAHEDTFATTITVTGTTWQGPLQATTTTLAVSPPDSQQAGEPVALTATVAPGDVAGSVEFLDGTASLGAREVTGGEAVLTTSDLAAGTHTLTARFTPTTAGFAVSTSEPVGYAITSPEAADTQTSLAVSPGGSQQQGSPVTMTATVTPAGAGGTVQFRDGTTSLGSVAVAAGTASFTTSALAAGTHSLTAVFAPADPQAFNSSTSAAVSYQIVGEPTATTTTLTTDPEPPVAQGTEVTLTAAVNPPDAAGTVDFLDGDDSLGTATVTSGTAILSTTALEAGEHTLTAAFTPEDGTAFAGSTSEPVAFEVSPPDEEPDLTVTDADGDELPDNPTLEPGDTVTIIARNFAGDEEVEVSLDDEPVETLTADGGVVETEFTVPDGADEGAHQLVFTGADHDVVFDFVVESDEPGNNGNNNGNNNGGGLPLTGMSIAMLAGSGLALTGGGAGLMLLTRRRQRTGPVLDGARAVEERAD